METKNFGGIFGFVHWHCFGITGLSIEMDDRESITIKKLELPEQWPVYKFQVRVLLKAADVWEIVNGTSKQPVAVEGTVSGTAQNDFDAKVSAWNKSDSKAQRIIVTSLGEDPIIHVMNCETARDMWVILEGIYEQKSQLSIQMLLESYYGFSRSEEDDIATHTSKLRNIVKRLGDLGEKISDTGVMAKILMTLPPELSHFNTSWDSTATADRTLENLISRLVTEEKRLEANHSNDFGNQALVAKRFGASGRMIKCFNCGKRGHVKKDCPIESSDEEYPARSTTKGSAQFSVIRGKAL